MNLRTITLTDADKLIDDLNLDDRVELKKTELEKLRQRIKDDSSFLKRPGNLPDINLNIVEDLLTECIRKFGSKKNHDIWEMENWLSARLHNVLRLTRREASINEIWYFLGLYFYNFILWRANYANRKTDSLNNVLLGLPASKISRQIFSRCWWMAEVTRIGKNYSRSPILNGDYVSQLLDVNMFKIQIFSCYLGEFIRSKKISQQFRQKFRTFMYLSRELIVAQPMTGLVQEKIDLSKYESWLEKPLKKDHITKTKEFYSKGPDDFSHDSDAKEIINKWFEKVWDISDRYYEIIEEVIKHLIEKNNEINIDEVIAKITDEEQPLLPRSEQQDIKYKFKEITER